MPSLPKLPNNIKIPAMFYSLETTAQLVQVKSIRSAIAARLDWEGASARTRMKFLSHILSESTNLLGLKYRCYYFG